jgi:hypothetical protein
MDCGLLKGVIIILVRKFIHERKIHMSECQFSLFQTGLFHEIFKFILCSDNNFCGLKGWTTLYSEMYRS